jgi:hypothetical protein
MSDNRDCAVRAGFEEREQVPGVFARADTPIRIFVLETSNAIMVYY